MAHFLLIFAFEEVLNVLPLRPAVRAVLKDFIGFGSLEASRGLPSRDARGMRLFIAFFVEGFDLSDATEGAFEFFFSFAGKSDHMDHFNACLNGAANIF